MTTHEFDGHIDMQSLEDPPYHEPMVVMRECEEAQADFAKRFGTSRVIREVYEDCDLHRALKNTGYTIRRKDYYRNGKYTGKVKDYYAPVVEGKQFPDWMQDHSAEPRYLRGRGGNMYPAEFVEMYPYTFGKR